MKYVSVRSYAIVKCIYLFSLFSKHGSEPEVLKGSIDTGNSGGSGDASLSTVKSNSPARKNSLHKYTEIDTMSRSDSTRSKMSHTVHAAKGDSGLHPNCTTDILRGLPKVIPPPPNMRVRSNSTPHFYYILEKLESGEEEGKRKGRLEHTWELGDGSQTVRVRGRSSKKRSSLKQHELREISADADSKNELCLEEGEVRRSRSGSCPSREWRGGGSLKRSRGGSAKSSTKSRCGSGKKLEPRDGSVKVHVSREGSIKSHGSRDGSFKKEVWLPAHEGQNHKEGKMKKMQVPLPSRDYDVLEPVDQYPPFSMTNESDFSKGGSGVLFDDPKYATVSVGDLPRLARQLHQSLDLIGPPRRGERREILGTAMNTASCKSLQYSGFIGRGGARKSIYQTCESARGSGMSISGNTPSRLSIPFDAYNSLSHTQ